MTHLKIEQNTTGIEEVSHSIIEKLYNLAISGDLDVSSNLQGRLHVSATYRSYVDYLTTNYPNLYITSSDYYVNFADPEVRRIFAQSNYGDGFGLLLSTAYTITNLNNVTISGTGNQFKNNTTIEHFDELGQFTSVTRLEMSPFQGTTNLKSIDLSNIQFINQQCFNNSGLTGTINLPSLTETQAYPFANCNSITQFNFSSSLTTPGEGLFAYLTGLQTVTGLSHLTSIPGALAASCSNLSSIDIDWSKITYIGNSAFQYCTSLSMSNLSIPNLTNIQLNAFRGCTGLQKVSDLGSITTIPQECFKDCTNLTEVTLPSTLTAINHGAFTNCTNLVINDINLPNLTTLASQSFYGTKVKKISNLGSIQSVGENCFQSCTNLTQAVLPSTCTTIKDHAFRGCSSLQSINLSSTITSIGENAFQGCTSLGEGQTLELNLASQVSYPHNALRNTKYSRLIVHSPQQTNTYDTRYPMYEDMNRLTYLDLSDFLVGPNAFDNTRATYFEGSFYNNTSLVTFIYPQNINSINLGLSYGKTVSSYRYAIILSTTPPAINTNDSNNPPSGWFVNSNLHIYVPDSAKAAYLADTDWASIGGYNGSDTIVDRLHGLSELPAEVWTTGLASQYLTAAQLATS